MKIFKFPLHTLLLFQGTQAVEKAIRKKCNLTTYKSILLKNYSLWIKKILYPKLENTYLNSPLWYSAAENFFKIDVGGATSRRNISFTLCPIMHRIDICQKPTEWLLQSAERWMCLSIATKAGIGRTCLLLSCLQSNIAQSKRNMCRNMSQNSLLGIS